MWYVRVRCTTMAIDEKKGNEFEKENERIMGEVGRMEESGDYTIIF